MMRTPSDQIPVIVIGLDCMTGLQTARIFASHDIPVIGVVSDLTHPCSHTRFCKTILKVDRAYKNLCDLLTEFSGKLDRKAALFPCSDLSVLQVSTHRSDLEPYYLFQLPDQSVIDLLVDKVSFYERASSEGLPVPKTLVLNSLAETKKAASELSYPSVVKPRLRTPEWEQHTSTKAFIVHSPSELIAVCSQCLEWTKPMLLQEWIEGPDENLYSCNCYLNSKSQPLVSFEARKLRQWPPRAGTSCLGEEVHNPTVKKLTLDLFQNVGLRGLGYLEIKKSTTTGGYYAIEPNVGRPTGRSAIAEAAGVDLLYTAYRDLTGATEQDGRRVQQYKGTKWIYVRRDLQAAFYYWRHDELTLKEWIRSVRGPKGFALFSWADPMPFLLDLRKSLFKAMRGLV